MKSELELTWTQTQNLVDALVFQVTKKHLGSSEVQVLRGAWDGKTYDAIASESHLAVKYIGEVGGKLWNNLSEALGEEVKKTNFRQALQRQWEKQGNKSDTIIIPEIQFNAIEFSESPYIERPPIESRCYEEICKPGALLRIQAPLQFGKTELMSRVMHYAAQHSFRASGKASSDDYLLLGYSLEEKYDKSQANYFTAFELTTNDAKKAIIEHELQKIDTATLKVKPVDK